MVIEVRVEAFLMGAAGAAGAAGASAALMEISAESGEVPITLTALTAN